MCCLIIDLTSYSDPGFFETYAVDEIVVTADTAFGEATLPDGTYAMTFDIWDARDNHALSDTVFFTCTEGQIYTSLSEI